MAYLIEVYLSHANNALAFNNLVRRVIATSLPLHVTPLLVEEALDIGGSVLGSICLVFSPVGFISGDLVTLSDIGQSLLKLEDGMVELARSEESEKGDHRGKGLQRSAPVSFVMMRNSAGNM